MNQPPPLSNEGDIVASKGKPNRPLTAKQKRFVEEYLVDLNARQAYLRAGYSPNPRTAPSESCRLLALPAIAKAIQKAKEKRSKRTEITQDRVLAEEKCIAYADLGDYFDEDGGVIPVHELPEQARRAIAGIKVNEFTYKDGTTRKTIEYKFWDKGGSLKRTGDHLGMYKNIHEHTGTVRVLAPEQIEKPSESGK